MHGCTFASVSISPFARPNACSPGPRTARCCGWWVARPAAPLPPQLSTVICQHPPFTRAFVPDPPGATGQVQDVGLIFLSSIASAVVQACTAAGCAPADTLATVLAAMTSATGIVGVLIIITGGAGVAAADSGPLRVNRLPSP